MGRNKEEIKQEWETLTKPDDDDQGDSGAIDIVVLNMPILDTRKHKNMEGVGQLISELVLNILSWIVQDERERMRAAQREGIEIAKKQGKYTDRSFKYHDGAAGKDKVIFDYVVQLLREKKSVMDIHKEVGLSRNTIYHIKEELSL